jgi:hypothetical protein
MKNAHPYPLPIYVLEDFRHPAEWHGLHLARRHGGETLAGNGYMALRVRKGAWIDSDFPPASAEFLSRFGKLPWTEFDRLPDSWRPLDSQRGRIFDRGLLGLWLKEKIAPTPVWQVGTHARVRLSMLQRMAMLPRAEIYTGHADKSWPAFFRFSGGVGIIAHDPRLTMHSGVLFPPARDHWSGDILPERRGPRPSFALPNWPPADTSDC